MLAAAETPITATLQATNVVKIIKFVMKNEEISSPINSFGPIICVGSDNSPIIGNAP